MRLLTRLAAALLLVLGAASASTEATAGGGGGSPAPETSPADAEIEARLEAGEVGRAAGLARAAIDREAAEPGRSPASIAEHLERLAGHFYGTATPEGTSAAEGLFARALAIREARAEREPAPLASLLHDLSGVAFNAGDYARAEEAERRALAIRERTFPPGDPRTAESRRDLALIFMAQGRLQEAAAELPKALEIIEGAAAGDWTQIAVGRNYLAELFRLEGRYAEASSLLEELVREAPSKLGPDSQQFPYFLNNLAGVYRDQDRFDEAETLLRRSLAIRRAATPRDDGAVARGTLNLAELYRAQGKLAEAEPLYRDALERARKTLGSRSPELFEFINQLAVLYREEGRLGEAEPRFREGLALVERGFGPDHPRVAQSRLDLAELLRMRGKCAAAEPHYQHAAEIREKTLGPDHPDVAEVLAAHARCLAADPSRRDAARASLDRAVAILGASEAYPAVAADALSLRAELKRPKDREGAKRDLAQALAVVEKMRPHRGGGEGVRAAFFGRYARLYERMVGWEVEGGRPDLALAAAERGRARVLLDQLDAAHVGESPSSTPELERRQSAARAELAEIRERLTFEQSRTDTLADEKHRRVAALERRLEESSRSFRELYDEARNASAAWRGAASGVVATAAEIQADVVPRDGLLLLYEIGSEGSFLFVVPPPPGTIEALPLSVARGDAVALGIAPGPLTGDALGELLTGKKPAHEGGGSPGLLAQLASPRDALSRGIGGLTRGADLDAGRLHHLWSVLIPTGLWPRVARASEVVVVPDGPLFLLPLEALVVEEGPDLRASRFWLDAGPVLRYAPSATFLHQLRSRPASAPTAAGPPAALSVSDPSFGPPGSEPAPSAPASLARGAYLGSGGRLTRLPGTATESRAVRDALEGVADVVVLAGPEAREPAVRRELPGKRFVHIATHGLVDEEQGEIFAALALAPPPSGAPTGDDDGFLQLFEIYELRLDCELAVLSACSSNTGRVVAGEGVFALSRGFLVGGARRVVASQWPVDDASTAALVGDLFRRVAAAERGGGQLDAARALRDAKLAVRRTKAEWAHPFFWAPFVITGLD